MKAAALLNAPVAKVMSRAGDSLRTAVEHMVDSGLRSLPVIDQGDRIIGMVSRNDLMTAISKG
jgi:predicted transcriptional regulator